MYTCTFLLQYLQDKTGLVDALLPSPPLQKSGASTTMTRAQAKRLKLISSDVSINTLGYSLVWVWLCHPKLIHFSLQELSSSSSESSSAVTRRKNPHPRKLNTTTTEITSDSDLEVVHVSLISGDMVVV